MKRTAKILLSAMLVLMFVFSFAGAVPAAWADYTETGAITSDNAVFLWNEETEAYDSYTGEVAIDFGKDSDNHPISYISSIKEYGISFLVPDGLYVEKVTLEAQGQREGEKVLDLSKYAVLDGSALKIPASAFENKADGSNILDVLGGSRTYVFSVFFRSIDPDATVEVTYTDGSLEGVLGTLVEGGNTFQSDKEGHTVLPLSDSVTPIKSYHKEFAGWKLVYENGISTEVSVGSVIHPYADAELVAQWEDIIVVIASQDGDIVYDGTAHKATVEVNGVPVSDESNKATVTLNGSSVTVEITDYDTDNSSITN